MNVTVIKSIMTLVIVGLLFGNARAGDVSRLYLKAVDNYETGNYQAAAETFSEIAEKGIRNGKLYYNTGNAWFKAGDVGRAILWYERAKPLRPNDPELAFNLSHARTLMVDKTPQENAVLHALFFWRDMIGQRFLVWTAVVFNALFAAGLFRRLVLKKYMPKSLLYAGLIIVIIAGGTAGFNMAAERFWSKGVVLPAAVSVKSGISDLSTELFVLHAGSKVTVETENKGYYRVRFGHDKIGWVSQKAIGMI
ncbi:MAG: hypothetical protein SWH61_09015 [Thermodesulfobacteriota bacterium]|nr:hypothetical protein [Thermodesulfobacteriota bacterium]